MNLAFSILSLVPIAWIGWLCLIVVLAFTLSFVFKVGIVTWARIVAFAIIVLVLLNPQATTESRTPIDEKMIIIVDESASQKIDGRDLKAEHALTRLQDELIKYPTIKPVIIRTDGQEESLRSKSAGTSLFPYLNKALSEFNDNEVSSIVMISDGQVSDIPENLSKKTPLNVIVTGRKGEKDHKIDIISMPKFGLIDGKATIKIKATTYGDGPVDVSMSQDGRDMGTISLADGEEKDVTVTLDHVGQNAVSFSIPVADGEISGANNRAVAVIKAIRDRLRVLLVSGAPHMGERAWRNLLKSDPAIDLVHFTILRSTQSMDATPADEMALIPFPVDEIFRNKISGFDLIILDRYRQYDLLPQSYFDGIRDYVEKGGALFLAVGTDMPDDMIFTTSLAGILPVAPTANESILTGDIMPRISKAGEINPVTAALYPEWAAWHGQAAFASPAEKTLMTGANGLPLLSVSEAGKGRVAVLSSDNIWIWSKSGPDGKAKGPYMPLIGNVIDWLTKEPDMEKGFIKAEADRDGKIMISLRPSDSPDRVVNMQDPEGIEKPITLSDNLVKGWYTAEIDAGLPGLYTFKRADKTAYAFTGGNVQAEFVDLISTDAKLKPLVEKTGGNIVWASEHPDFFIGSGRADDEVRVDSKKPYAVNGIASRRVIPDWLGIALIIASLMGCWWQEGRRR